MKSKPSIEKYHEYKNKIGDRKELYRSVAEAYSIKSALYPGSHIDIAPSLVIPKVIYVDNFKGAITFFKDMEAIKQYVHENKIYKEPCALFFLGQDYTAELFVEPVDLIISQYAGFVGQATKKYLKTGGILLCNDSHGDATLTQFDDDFEFLGVLDEKNRIMDKKLKEYFLLPGNKKVDLKTVKEKMKGPKYKVTAENYLFRKIH